MGLPFLFGTSALGHSFRCGQSRIWRRKEPAGRWRYGMARSLKFVAEACRDLASATFRRNTEMAQQFRSRQAFHFRNAGVSPALLILPGVILPAVTLEKRRYSAVHSGVLHSSQAIST